MSSHEETFRFAAAAPSLRDACQEAALQLGWQVRNSSSDAFEFRAQAAGSMDRVTTIKAQIAQDGVSSKVVVKAEIFGMGPFTTKVVKTRVATFRNALEVALRRGSDGAIDSAAPTQDIVSQIQGLEDLRTKGVLTEDEFMQAKARLLGGGSPVRSDAVRLRAETEYVATPEPQRPRSKDPFSRR